MQRIPYQFDLAARSSVDGATVGVRGSGRRRYSVWAGCTVAAFSCAVASAAQPPPPPAGQENISARKMPDRDDDSWLPPKDEDPGRSAAEDLLNELRRKRPRREVTPPASALGKPSPATARVLLSEGADVVSRPGRIERDGPWWRFVFEPDQGEPAIRLLPNAALEVMVRTAGGSAGSTGFVVSGEVTVFGDMNYLLVRLARRATGASGAGPTPMPVLPPAGPSVRDAAAAPPAPAEQVLQALREQKPRDPAMPLEPMAAGSGHDATSFTQALRPEGSPVARRPGRLIRESDWWVFLFESDHPDHPDPPMKLLPNKTLELMARPAGMGDPGIVYIVSGEVTVFEGENYLFPRAAIRRTELGNLRR